MARVVQGDVGALGTLFERYKGPLYAFLRRYLPDDALAEDVVVDAFLRVHDRRRTYKLGMKFSTWLYAIAYHLAADRLRRNARLLSLDEGLREAGCWHDDPTGASCARAELAETVRAAIARLPEDLRVTIILREYAGFSYREIAAITHVSEEAVRVRAFRARQALKTSLQPYVADASEAAVTFAAP